MNSVIVVVLCIAVVLLIVRNSILIRKNSVLTEKARLYGEFVKKPGIKSFLSTVNKVKPDVFDLDVKFIIKKYFERVLNLLEYRNAVDFLNDISKSKYADILQECLILATEKDEGIFGISLSAKFDHKEDREKIEQFLAKLSVSQRRVQYRTAIDILQEKLDNVWCDFPLEHRKMVKEVIIDFENKIK